VSDPVVPAERVFVEEDPGVSHAKRDGGEKRREDAPAAEPAACGASIEAGEFEALQA